MVLVCQMASATPPDNLKLGTIPEPANIARHRCLKTKKAKYNRVGACDTKNALQHDHDMFFGLVSLILQKK